MYTLSSTCSIEPQICKNLHTHTQAIIWNLDNASHEEGTLPLTPNANYVVSMLVQLSQVQRTVTVLGREAGALLEQSSLAVPTPSSSSPKLEQLSSSNKHVAISCNELAASVLTVIKSSNCLSTQELSLETQTLSHEIARAVKGLNTLIKRGAGGRKRSQAAGRRAAGTSLATGQVTHAPPMDNASFEGIV